jgi:hypothetical protein
MCSDSLADEQDDLMDARSDWLRSAASHGGDQARTPGLSPGGIPGIDYVVDAND